MKKKIYINPIKWTLTRGNIDSPNTHTRDRTLYWLGTDTSLECGGVEIRYGPKPCISCCLHKLSLSVLWFMNSYYPFGTFKLFLKIHLSFLLLIVQKRIQHQESYLLLIDLLSVFGVSALTWFIRYIFYWNLKFLNNVNINETKTLFSHAQVALADFGNTV